MGILNITNIILILLFYYYKLFIKYLMKIFISITYLLVLKTIIFCLLMY